MKSHLIEGASLEELNQNLSAWLMTLDAPKDQKHTFPEMKVHNVQLLAMQKVIPNAFNANQPRVEQSFNLLIIYSW